MMSVHTVIALAAFHSWPIYQMDVKNVFMYGSLTEEVYMKPPKGLSVSSSNFFCKLKQSLYSLKQAPWDWFTKF